ncbi:MAG TPA: SDR family oxidoreductase [Burkholderiaceae bacterium]|jgi:NAD(P)-dependent dehydrogenase (short-subunit alcohol dehydrogenase family)
MTTSAFEGSIVVVTGGAAGIGAAVSRSFIAQGARVAVLDRDPRGAPEGASIFEADVADNVAVDAAIHRFGEAHGRIDLLVNNAGVSFPATVEDGELDEWHRVFDINVLGYVRAIRASLPYLRRAKHASIVNMSSCTASTGLRRRVMYSAAKGAIEAMSRAMAADLVHEGIRVNCVSPGTVDTPLIQKLIDAAPDPAAQRQVYDDRQPTGFMLSADEVARAVLYLSDPRNVSTVGTVLTVDGGLASLRLFNS